jgi:hypothetical protein
MNASVQDIAALLTIVTSPFSIWLAYRAIKLSTKSLQLARTQQAVAERSLLLTQEMQKESNRPHLEIESYQASAGWFRLKNLGNGVAYRIEVKYRRADGQPMGAIELSRNILGTGDDRILFQIDVKHATYGLQVSYGPASLRITHNVMFVFVNPHTLRPVARIESVSQSKEDAELEKEMAGAMSN